MGIIIIIIKIISINEKYKDKKQPQKITILNRTSDIENKLIEKEEMLLYKIVNNHTYIYPQVNPQ